MKPDREKAWTHVNVQQFSTLDTFERHFYLNMKMGPLFIYGLHSYKDVTAIMDIRLAGLLRIVNGKGKEMDKAETVTVLNDMCIMAPGSLIDERITWETIDSLTAKAIFTNEDITVSAILYFNKEGQLINFVSNDRYYSPTGDKYESIPWSTPISHYQNINGYNLATYGEAIWMFTDGDYCYAKFNIKDVKYNI